MAALTLALAVACTSSVDATARLVGYASGDWGCRFRGGTLNGTELAVTVRARDDASGTFAVRYVHVVDPPRRFSGSWQLEDDRLTLRPVKPAGPDAASLGPVYGRHVRLDTRRITMRGETAHDPGSGDPVPVTVHRDGDRIVFGTDALGPVLPGVTRHSTIACAKSG